MVGLEFIEMRVASLSVVAAIALAALAHCAPIENTESEENVDPQRSALCSADWSPTWRFDASANEWWIEVILRGGDIASVRLEIVGGRSVSLSRDPWGRWTGTTGGRIPAGTTVVLHAEDTAGRKARTVPFPYLQTVEPSTASCDASCGGAWQPTFEQSANANTYWVEFSISGAVSSARLEIVGGATVPLTYQWQKWVGSFAAGIATGTSVILHAESTTGQVARSRPFRYRVDTRPTVAPGICGSCGDFAPTWQQESGANRWWPEFRLTNGTAQAVRLEVVGGGSVSLTNRWGKWGGSYPTGIETGAWVILHAESSTNLTAETIPFRYLVDTTPTTKPCSPETTPDDVGLEGRPSNTSCIAPARPGTASSVALTSVYGDLFTAPASTRVQAPMLMAQRPGNGSRWFLAQRDGRIVSFDANGSSANRDLRQLLSASQFSALTGKTVTLADEGGFHGMVFDPDFASNGRLYVSFSTTCDGNVPICDDPLNINGDYYRWATEIGYLISFDGGASFTGYQRLMHIGRWSQMHYGGSLAFGRDGYLYISSGDGLEDSAAQFNNNYFGKILRIDPKGTPSGGRNYAIPSTNPFAAGGGRPEIFAWGLRNPFRMSVDRATGDIWVGDVGQDSWEEVNRIQRGGNYGWPCREGAHPGHAWNQPSKCPSQAGLIDPIFEHAHSGIGRSVTGGYVYRGSAIGGFQGTYVYGDFMQKELWGLRFENGAWNARILNGAGPRDGYVSFAEDSEGELYAVSLFDQKIHKLVPGTGGGVPVTFPDRLSQTGCVLENDPTKPAAGVIPYDVNAELWSDGADKERYFAIPNGTRITVGQDGDFDFPVGTVLLKTFSLGGRRVETRLYVRHADGEWGGYSYEWNDAQTDATLLSGGKVKNVGGQPWSFPSRSECGQCHTSAAGRSLGLEIGQLNGSMLYPSTGRTANQLRTLEHVGFFASPLGDPTTLVTYPKPFEGAFSASKARAYLHANCASCHRPDGGAGRSTIDLRFATPLSNTSTCNASPIVDNFGNNAFRIVRPGLPNQSILSLRMHTLDARRMPPLASSIRDTQGTSLIDTWISSLTGCP